MTTFVDRVVLHVAAGRRRPRLRLGPPREVQAARRPGRRQRRPRRRHRPRRRPGDDHAARLPPRAAPARPTNGKPGQGDHRNGADGEDLVLPVPDGTVVTDRDGDVLADLVGAGADAASSRAGGRGGLGNAALASHPAQGPGLRPARRAGRGARRRPRAQDRRRRRPGRLPERRQVQPRRGDVGGPAEDRRLPVHHAGAQPRRRRGGRDAVHRRRRPRPDPRRQRGQGARAWSSCATSSAARSWCTCSTAPPSSPGRDPVSDLDVIEAELARVRRPRRTGPGSWSLNKIDVPEARELAEHGPPDLEARGLAGVRDLAPRPTRGCARCRSRWPSWSPGRARRRRRRTPTRIVLRPRAVDDAGFTRHAWRTVGSRVRGAKPERWVRQTDFSNDEAVGYLADRLARLGVEDALRRGRRRVRATRSSIGGDDGASCSTGSRRLSAGAAHAGRAARRGTRPAARGAVSPRDASAARSRSAADRRQGRVVVADQRAGAAWTRAAVDALVDALVRAPRAGRRGRAGLLRRDRGRARAAGAQARARATWPPSRPPPASGRACSCTATPRRSPGTGGPSARCC